MTNRKKTRAKPGTTNEIKKSNCYFFIGSSKQYPHLLTKICEAQLINNVFPGFLRTFEIGQNFDVIYILDRWQHSVFGGVNNQISVASKKHLINGDIMSWIKSFESPKNNIKIVNYFELLALFKIDDKDMRQNVEVRLNTNFDLVNVNPQITKGKLDKKVETVAKTSVVNPVNFYNGHEDLINFFRENFQ